MNGFESQRQDSMKRRSWQQLQQQDGRSFPNIKTARFVGFAPPSTPTPPPPFLSVNANSTNNPKVVQSFPGLEDDDLVSTVVPPVTVVLEGRSICHRISLHKHASYRSLAKALRQMFVEGNEDGSVNSTTSSENDVDLDLSNAVPDHLVAYEDMENDLLLAGDLNWKDFVRVAKRIRILPAKGNSKKAGGGA